MTPCKTAPNNDDVIKNGGQKSKQFKKQNGYQNKCYR